MTLGSFHSTKTSENVCGNGGKWNGIFQESLQEVRELLNFRRGVLFNFKLLQKAGAKLTGKKTLEKKFSKIWLYLAR